VGTKLPVIKLLADEVRMMKQASIQIIGRTIRDLFCTYPDADRHPYGAVYLLHLDDNSWVALQSGTINRFELAEMNGVQLFRHQVAERLQNRAILAALCCRSTAYDQSFLIVEGPLRIANCTISTERMLMLRDTFDEQYEAMEEYWDYFTGDAVDYLGNARAGSRRPPDRVPWH